MVGDQVGALFEGDAEELRGGPEHAIVQHSLEFEVWLELGGVDVVLLGSHALGVEVPICGAELELAALGLDRRLQVCALAASVASGCWGNLAKHRVHVGWCLCGAVHQDVFCVAVDAEQLCSLGAQLGDLEHELAVVVVVAAKALAHRSADDSLAQLAVGEALEQWVPGEVDHGD